ncbi:HNH endonuclease [Cytobacillus firmus]|uniref:HNH endonuclease n=1 Tax=Cytobacillus firmus TaxID=1399 RepID=UPI0021C93633|nr:HNH endonuclease signature motif containing protein [Cytobacillus firmus]MCU1806375.1 HNH endonuclease [Cytobacillus firmus]
MDYIHEGILKKFQALKGKLLIGKAEIKGIDSNTKLPPDQFVAEPHILHDLIRGFYKPAKKPYLLSYQATESESNYGKQIIWEIKGYSFLKIEMHPPSGERDNRKKSDISAARYNLANKIPIGILHKEDKGQNRVLGLGIIVSERADGVFIVEPFEYKKDSSLDVQIIREIFEEEEIDTNIVQQIVHRRGQDKFKKKLLLYSNKCAVCGINDKSFLIASHIKPWRYSNNKERLDGNNGLLLCPNHDKLFDSGYISFSENGSLLVSSKLSKDILIRMGLTSEQSIEISKEREVYMSWHREFYFKK